MSCDVNTTITTITTTTTKDDENSNHPLAGEIDHLVWKRSELRKDKKWQEADQIKAMLAVEPYLVDLTDLCDGSTTWKHVVGKEMTPMKIVQWSKMNVPRSSSTIPFKNNNTTSNQHIDDDDDDEDALPLLVATVDSPHYRERLHDTLEHLKEVCRDEDGKPFFKPEPIDLLDLAKHPNLGPRRILFEGWRTILLPHLLSSLSSSSSSRSDEHNKNDNNNGNNNNKNYYARDGFVLVAEDDIRFSPQASDLLQRIIRDECTAAFRSNPDVHILSLGHAWAAPRQSRRQRRRGRQTNTHDDEKKKKNNMTTTMTTNHNNKKPDEASTMTSLLFHHLQKGGGVHATTLLAIRAPTGIQCLLDAMNGVLQEGKKTHLDQFLFLSTLHNVGLALSDPPLVGWAEVSTTLTSVGSGTRREGGGRLGHLPPKSQQQQQQQQQQRKTDNDPVVEWVQRQVVVATKEDTDQD